MSDLAPIWIREAEVVEAMNLDDAIHALEAGLQLQADGGARNLPKTHCTGGNWQMHAIGAAFDAIGRAGAKAWVHTLGGATPLLMLWSLETGALLAVIEAFALGQMRTAGVSGVATRWMASASAQTFALIGAGKQALPQLAAVAAVRPLKTVRLWSRDEAKQARFAESVRGLGFDFEIELPRTVGAATDGADIVTLATRAREAIFSAAMAAPGAHINSIGSITPEREEFSQDLFPRAGLIVADDPPAARELSREFQTWLAGRPPDGNSIIALSDLIARKEGRSSSCDVSIFKAMGMGVSDLALATEIYARALTLGFGRTIDKPEKVAPRLR